MTTEDLCDDGNVLYLKCINVNFLVLHYSCYSFIRCYHWNNWRCGAWDLSALYLAHAYELVSQNLKSLTEILSDSKIDEMYKILKNIEDRLLTDDEIAKLKKTPKIGDLNRND